MLCQNWIESTEIKLPLKRMNQTSDKCWYNTGPASATLARCCTNIYTALTTVHRPVTHDPLLEGPLYKRFINEYSTATRQIAVTAYISNKILLLFVFRRSLCDWMPFKLRCSLLSETMYPSSLKKTSIFY